MERTHYYHVTQAADWGKEIRLKPRNFGRNRAPEEPQTARICVGPSVAHCLTALGSSLYISTPIHIYRTKYRVTAVKPNHVEDARITKEMWLLRPIRFVHVGTLDAERVDALNLGFDTGAKEYARSQTHHLQRLQTELADVA